MTSGIVKCHLIGTHAQARMRPVFTHGYRKGGQFLLMLKKWDGAVSEVIAGRPLDGYTIAWNPLGAVNEQLRAPDDLWVQWVRQQVKR